VKDKMGGVGSRFFLGSAGSTTTREEEGNGKKKEEKNHIYLGRLSQQRGKGTGGTEQKEGSFTQELG